MDLSDQLLASNHLSDTQAQYAMAAGFFLYKHVCMYICIQYI